MEHVAPVAKREFNALIEIITSWFAMNREVSATSRLALRMIWLLILGAIWHFVPILPSPGDMWASFAHFVTDSGLIGDIFTSLSVNVRAIMLAGVISLGLVYLAVLPCMRPLVEILSKLRFLSPAALLVIFMLYAPDGDWLKVIILTFGITVFMMTDMAEDILNIPQDSYDEARTLGLPEWKVTREVVVFGKAPAAFKALRVSAGMGWAMIALVEGLVRNQGGIGTVFLAQERHLGLAGMFALGFLLLAIGIIQDQVISTAAKFSCRFAFLKQGRTS